MDTSPSATEHPPRPSDIDLVNGVPDERENFIPLRKADVIELLAREEKFTGEEASVFRDFCKLLEALYHFKFHESLEALKEAYAPFNPDSDTLTIEPPSPEELARREEALTDELKRVLVGANYEELDEPSVLRALEVDSGWGIHLHVELSDFEQFMLFTRGKSMGTKYKRSLRTLFREKPYTVPIYKRLAVLVKFKDTEQNRKRYDTRNVYLKLFKDVPQADLEMLFPNTVIRMKGIDKVKISAPMLIGLVSMAWKFGWLVLAAVGFKAAADRGAETGKAGWYLLAAVLAGVIGYLVKSVKGYFDTKTRYMATLTKSLYFLNLDNNAGVFQHIIDLAEEEEVKEAVLAWYFLATEGPRSEADLDRRIETWLHDRTGHDCDFEVDDAVRKLEELRLLRRDGDRIAVKNLHDSAEQLDYEWDNYFSYNNA